MYNVLNIQVSGGNALHSYLDETTKYVNNLYNAVLFRARQVMTFVQKPKEQWTENEKFVHDEMAKTLPLMDEKFAMPTKRRSVLSYRFLDALFKNSGNADYFCEKISRQTAQSAIKSVVRDMKSFREAAKAYKRNPQAFTGKLKPPHYGKKGGNHTLIFSNQDCVIYPKENGKNELKFPGTKERLFLGDAPINGRLKQVTVKPTHGIFIVSIVLEGENKAAETQEPQTPSRICAIDLGVNNLAAITNNIGEECLLFKGGVIKSINQLYNKKMAKIQSAQTTGTADQFVMTDETRRLCLRRNNCVNDFLNKVAKRIIDWCVKNYIDTIVVGSNKMQKQSANMGKKNNQEFVQIPFFKFCQNLEYRAERVGIAFIRQEESYTSKASFVHMDYIPTYGADDEKSCFSGSRVKRGLYRVAKGEYINADLNAGANILRKAFPAAFAGQFAKPDFRKVRVVKRPDYEKTAAMRKSQLKEKKECSKSKLRRLAAKQAA